MVIARRRVAIDTLDSAVAPAAWNLTGPSRYWVRYLTVAGASVRVEHVLVPVRSTSAEQVLEHLVTACLAQPGN